MSTVCGRPQGGRWGPAHVDACGQGEVKNVIFCGHHKWMAPNERSTSQLYGGYGMETWFISTMRQDVIHYSMAPEKVKVTKVRFSPLFARWWHFLNEMYNVMDALHEYCAVKFDSFRTISYYCYYNSSFI